MGGLRRLTKLYGGMVVQGVHHVWDYVADEPVLQSEMPVGSQRWKASEKAKWEAVKAATPNAAVLQDF